MSVLKKLSTVVALAVTASTLALTPASARAAGPDGTAAAVGWPPAAPSQLVIDTGGVAVGREDYVPGTVTLDGVTRVTEVRGRGNSTWGWAKKPYKLKLEQDAALVGTRAFDEWVLLAGYGDRSSLRTAAAFAVAAQTRLRWTPQFRFVEVVLNGQPQGLYLLTEQVEAGAGRVDLPDDGYLLEVNQRYLRDDEPGFRTRRGTPVAFKDPDEVTKRQRREVRRAVSRFEDVLYGPDFADPERGYAAHVDVGRMIDWYIVQELFANQDSNFQSSVHFSWVPGKRFVFGPVWDFDLSAGTRWRASSEPDTWHTRLGRHWITRMLQDPAFSERVKSRWARLKPGVREVVSQISAAAATLAPAAEADWDRWHATGDLDWTHRGLDRQAEVDFLRDWLTRRIQWLSLNEVRLGGIRHRATERARTVWVPVRLQSAPSTPVRVTYAVQAGTATAGEDFLAAQGQLDFAAGQVEQRVPVRILDDRETEARETVQVGLTGASSDLVVGSPATAVVAIAANTR
ncbi:CotH kinase family protein [Nocardioides sp. zg-1228]|uniref:CotH kinase family protein n=1 Tax=Nocardioides sp. zg-1228 TaxID=2763008 RepID=UPI0016425F38|nr:CotH kinase family protein [Nocardioides sp. zg-1228]MBC2933143.1 CotH kinase family protein [Nocardioides sp. zg-1228]QSF56674.1 CotH kinase family protein [Nocardioides sp. zg-1228]